MTRYVASRDGRRVVYRVSAAGSDWTEWRIRDLESGRDLFELGSVAIADASRKRLRSTSRCVSVRGKMERCAEAACSAEDERGARNCEPRCTEFHVCVILLSTSRLPAPGWDTQPD